MASIRRRSSPAGPVAAITMSPRTRTSPSSAAAARRRERRRRFQAASPPSARGSPTLRARHPPHLADRDPDRGEELIQLHGAGSATHVGSQRSKPQAGADLGEDRLVGPRPGARELGIHRLAGLLGPHLAHPELDRLQCGRPLASSGSAWMPASSAAISFSQTRGTAPKRVGRASIVCSNTRAGSGQVATVSPRSSACRRDIVRSAMCALGETRSRSRRARALGRRRARGTGRARCDGSAGHPWAARSSQTCRSESRRRRAPLRARRTRSRTPGCRLRSRGAARTTERRSARRRARPSAAPRQPRRRPIPAAQMPPRSRRAGSRRPGRGMRSARATRCCRSKTASRRGGSPLSRTGETRAGW